MKCLPIKNNQKNKGQSYISSLLKTLIWPFLFVLFSYLINFIFSFIYIYNHNDVDPVKLSNYLYDNSLLIVIITFIIVYPILFKKYKKFNLPKQKLTIKKIINLSLIGLSLAILLNLIIYNLDNVLNLTNRYENIDSRVFIMIVTTGLLGPILEEYLFRGIVYNKLKQFNSKKVAVILTSIIFSLIHLELTQIIYALIFSFVLIYIYEKDQNLKAPIITHIIGNTSVVLLMQVITSFNLMISITVSIICIIMLIINFKILKLDNNRT